jgi:hypothetical protein
MSCYTPSWVKKDATRFPRMVLGTGVEQNTSNVISIFEKECVAADTKAFVALMSHLKEVDAQRTVILVQVQNEVGLLGDSRDRSQTANNLFESPVPVELANFLYNDWESLLPDLQLHLELFRAKFETLPKQTQLGSWGEMFGDSVYTDELFMAYHYALFVEQVAAAGRTIHEIPLFTNAWLPKPGTTAGGNVAAGGNLPGDYPSGGPVSNVIDIWQKFSPTLDFLSPDIYTSDYSITCEIYSHRQQALFIPEQRRDEYGARRVWQAVGKFNALGASPFGIDTLKAGNCAYTRHYKLLKSVSQIILKAQMKPDSIFGFFFDEIESTGIDPTPAIVKRFGNYDLTISRAFVLGNVGPGCGMIIQLEAEKFLLVGWGFKVEWKSVSPTSLYTGILRFLEKSVVNEADGTRRTERKLNGDETRSGMWANMPNEIPDYGDSFIPLSIPARTMIAEVTVYSLEK